MKKVILFVFTLLLLVSCASEKREYNVCNACSKYTVRRPVEIIYEDTTYTTVYTPKTYISKQRVSKPYIKCKK